MFDDFEFDTSVFLLALAFSALTWVALWIMPRILGVVSLPLLLKILASILILPIAYLILQRMTQ